MWREWSSAGFGTVPGVSGFNSNLCLLPCGLQLVLARVSWRLSRVQVYRVQRLRGRRWLGVTIWCDVVVMRPKVKDGVCSAVGVAAWGRVLLSLYLGQIFVSLPLLSLRKLPADGL